MNDLTVIQTAQGLFAYCQSFFPSSESHSIIIGFDARYNSKKWAYITAKVFIEGGWRALIFRDFCPTPFVSFGVTFFSSACGVMVTASHNPKDDNGYKVFWNNGAQIIPPHDKGISDSIDLSLIPKDSSWGIENIEKNKLCIDPTDEILKSYLAKQKNLCYTPGAGALM
ncbi:unnamed protein product [Protopolystoma xenopodis]|uniref:Alpha-D-phosphohexomutase alpha/beta/alpha domain-containing protein n=1 Tax=Protopolystoma xenopodis TaxID=117903 RepID=A0A3S4ZUP3_9PLAT|nr:unnamed protein product [Protopolystoma xenopodis]